MPLKHGIDTKTQGFTLVELSVVLVVIGLIVGGILVGRALIRSAETRAAIAQIEKYQSAVHAFKLKYNNLPGDINAKDATAFGFAPRGNYQGEGDGNGIIEGIFSDAAGQNTGVEEAAGETVTFWMDLSKANLIDGSFNTGVSTVPAAQTSVSGTIDLYYPHSKLGNGTSILVYSYYGINYFNIVQVKTMNFSVLGTDYTLPTVTNQQAYNIDTKLDDGLPQSGNVTTMYATSFDGSYPEWVGDSDPAGGPNGGPVVAGDGVSTAPTATTCYDNGSVPGATEKYTLSKNQGYGTNCTLSFNFQ